MFLMKPPYLHQNWPIFATSSKEKLPMNRRLVYLLTAVLLLGAVYRMVPPSDKPQWLGSPQLAIALFAGSIITNKKWAFAIPLFSLLLSDLLMQGLHAVNPAYMPGFYKGQLLNYILIVGLSVIGFFVNHRKAGEIIAALLAAPLLYFVLSNFAVWAGHGGLGRPATFEGLLQTYADGLPFLKSSMAGTLVFGLVFFAANYSTAYGFAKKVVQ
jgi:hypothetical protein